MALTVLEPEGLYPDTSVEDSVWQGAAWVLRGNAVNDMSSLPDASSDPSGLNAAMTTGA